MYDNAAPRLAQPSIALHRAAARCAAERQCYINPTQPASKMVAVWGENTNEKSIGDAL